MEVFELDVDEITWRRPGDDARPRQERRYINSETLDLFEQAGADPALLALLRQALGTRTEMDVPWERRSHRWRDRICTKPGYPPDTPRVCLAV